jgi:hypothetical protein
MTRLLQRLEVIGPVRRRIAAAMLAVFLVAAGYTAAAAAVGGTPPPVTSPTPTAGPYFSGPVHECVNLKNEGLDYFELHTDSLGNCGGGYVQLTVNELTPTFALKLGSTVYTCSAVTSATPETAVTCATPARVPSS